jgi:hypothetical protein
LKIRLADHLHSFAPLVRRHFDVPLGRSQLTVSGQFHDGFDAHEVIGQCGDEAPATAVAGRYLYLPTFLFLFQVFFLL